MNVTLYGLKLIVSAKVKKKLLSIAKACSNSSTFGPVVNQSDRRTATTASISSSSMDWRA